MVGGQKIICGLRATGTYGKLQERDRFADFGNSVSFLFSCPAKIGTE